MNTLVEPPVESYQAPRSYWPTPSYDVLDAHLQAIEDGAPMVDLQQRAENIGAALTEMSMISSILYGLVRTVHRDSGQPIRARYGDRFDDVVDGAESRALRSRYVVTRRILGSVVGYKELRTSGQDVMSKSEIKAEARVEWSDFVDMFNGRVNRGRRDDYKKVLKKQITTQKRLRAKLGMTDLTNN